MKVIVWPLYKCLKLSYYAKISLYYAKTVDNHLNIVTIIYTLIHSSVALF